MGAEPFIGRSDSLGTVLGAWEQARSEGRQVVLVAGAPGLGKTRLASEIANVVRGGPDGSCHWGRGWESGGTPALWPWIQILRSCFELSGVSKARAGLGTRAALLDDVVGAANPAPGSSTSPFDTQFTLFDTIESFLAALSQEQPLLLIMDDLHACDPSTLHLLDLVMRSRAPARMLVLGTFRPNELRATAGGGEVVATGVREGRVLELQALSDEEVRALATALDETLPKDVIDALPDLTAGNPLFVREITRSASRSTTQAAAVPIGLANALRDRLNAASETLGEVLATASVIGRTVPVPVLVALVDSPEAAARRDVGRAVAEGLVKLDARSDEFTFVHDLVRSSLYDELPVSRREELHARAAAALERLYEHQVERHADLIAHHHVRSGDVSTGKAMRFLHIAGSVAMRRFAYEAAEERFQLALALCGDDSESRCDVLISLGTAQRRNGSTSADETLIEAAQLARVSQDGDRLALALITLIGTAGQNPYLRDHQRIALVEDALENLPPQDERLRARLLACLVVLLSDPEDAIRREDALKEALDLTRTLEDDLVAAEVLFAAAVTMFFQRTDAQRGYVKDLFAAVDRLRKHAPPIVQIRARELELYARRLRTTFLLEEGDILGFERDAAAVIKGAGELNQPLHFLGAECLRSARDQMLGRVDAIERRAGAFAQLLPESMLAFVAYMVHTGWALFEQDRLAEMKDLLTELLEGMPRLTGLRLFLAMEAIQGGRPAEAKMHMAPLATKLSSLPYDAQWLSFVAGSAWIFRELELDAACEEVYELLQEHGHEHVVISFGQASCYLGSVELHLGLAAAGSRRLDVAIRHLETAVSAHDEVGASAWAARSRFELARAIAEKDGNTTEAITVAQGALDQLRDVPMLYLKRQITGFIEGVEHATTARIGKPTFEREGDVWLVRGWNSEVRVKNVRGMEYLERLTQLPDVELYAAELLSGPHAESSQHARDVLPSTTSTVPLLDEQAKREYRQRIRDLEEDIQEADMNNDTERRARLQSELDMIMDELRRAAGLAGRTRSFTTETEKARISVTKAIRRAIAAIRTHDPMLAEELDRRIMTGTFCCYRTDPVTRPRS